MQKGEETALKWYSENVHTRPPEDYSKITTEVKEYELTRNAFMLGVHYEKQLSAEERCRSRK